VGGFASPARGCVISGGKVLGHLRTLRVLFAAFFEEDGEDHALEGDGDEGPHEGFFAGVMGEEVVGEGTVFCERDGSADEFGDADEEGGGGEDLEDQGGHVGAGEIFAEVGVAVLVADLDDQFIEAAFEFAGAGEGGLTGLSGGGRRRGLRVGEAGVFGGFWRRGARGSG